MIHDKPQPKSALASYEQTGPFSLIQSYWGDYWYYLVLGQNEWQILG
jgi:hypothetical protein